MTMKLDPCPVPGKCPWKIKPMVGMYAKVDGTQVWGTNCLLYCDCPDPRWNTMALRWKSMEVTINSTEEA